MTSDPASPGRRRLFSAVACCALAAALGCEEELPPGMTRKGVKLDEVPATVLDAARKAIPGVELKDAWQNLDAQGKLHSYEVRGRNPNNGKTREVRVSTTGAILESE